MDSNDSQVEEIVNRACAQLAEHFDSVQIFVTRHKGENQVTQNMEVGRGNFYARLGHVREWLCMQDQFTRQHAIRKDAE